MKNSTVILFEVNTFDLGVCIYAWNMYSNEQSTET